MGKGREIAAMAYEHTLTGGARTLWVSVSGDLRVDAARDIDDIKAGSMPTLTLYPPRGTTSWTLPQGDLDWPKARASVFRKKKRVFFRVCSTPF